MKHSNVVEGILMEINFFETLFYEILFILNLLQNNNETNKEWQEF